MKENTIVSLADSNYFELLNELIDSIQKFEKSKSWLAKKLSSSENYSDQVISVLEERSIWQRYGF